MTLTIKYPSVKSSLYVRDLLAQRAGIPAAEIVRGTLNAAREAGTLSQSDVSNAIKTLLTIPKPKPTAEAPAPADPTYIPVKGDVHKMDDTYYRIHRSQRNGYLYAAKAVIISQAIWNEDDGSLIHAGRVQWQRAGGAMKFLSGATKVTPFEAKAFAKMVGRCVYCTLKIDTPESVSAGYGPVCAAQRGLPWGAS